MPICDHPEKSFRMTCSIEFPDRWRWPPSFERVEPDETTLFAVGMPSAQDRIKRRASDWRSSDGISLSEFGILDSAYALGMMSMRPVSGAAVAFH